MLQVYLKELSGYCKMQFTEVYFFAYVVNKLAIRIVGVTICHPTEKFHQPQCVSIDALLSYRIG